MVELNWTDEAKYWLKHIFEYIAQYDATAAQKVIDGICQKVDLLVKFPDIGYKYGNPSISNVRIIVYGHYRIAYLTVSKTQIDILAVIHGRMDIHKYFENFK
ncbi:MAG: type II toxin-antitoxin system RelE/ParE family toxin [Kiritimatiellae bacterium]|nr:type II toxin-antitoxin system RelE/ParE family toxin [Kiritimatiellia bacterium]